MKILSKALPVLVLVEEVFLPLYFAALFLPQKQTTVTGFLGIIIQKRICEAKKFSEMTKILLLVTLTISTTDTIKVSRSF